MKIFVHIRDQTFEVECGQGRQRVQWLGDVAVHRYEHFFGVNTGVCRALRLEDGSPIDVHGIINNTLEEEMHVWVVLKDDIIAELKDESKAGQNTSLNLESIQEGFAGRLRPKSAFNS